MRSEKRPLTLLILGALVVFIILGVVLLLISRRNIDPIFVGQQVQIQNASTYIKESNSKNQLEGSKYDIYQTIKNNPFFTSDISIEKISDAIIRDGSFSQEYDSGRDIYIVRFIVDIPSIGHSYNVRYEWSESGDDANFTEYGTVVTCPSKDQLIYGEFECWDIFSTHAGSNDPIVKILPYESDEERFKITSTQDGGRVSAVNIYAYTCNTDLVDTINESALNWLRSQNINPSDYNIVFDNC